ncbi:hypothetical protein STEG23_027755 [Scotinomys teguina]
MPRAALPPGRSDVGRNLERNHPGKGKRRKVQKHGHVCRRALTSAAGRTTGTLFKPHQMHQMHDRNPLQTPPDTPMTRTLFKPHQMHQMHDRNPLQTPPDAPDA